MIARHALALFRTALPQRGDRRVRGRVGAGRDGRLHRDAAAHRRHQGRLGAVRRARSRSIRVPFLTERIMPFAVLVGAMSCYLNLSRRLELVVARAAGMSAWQFVAPARHRRAAARRRRDHDLQSDLGDRCASSRCGSRPSCSAAARAVRRTAAAASGCASAAMTARPSSTPSRSRQQGIQLGGVTRLPLRRRRPFPRPHRGQERGAAKPASGGSKTRASTRAAAPPSTATPIDLKTNLTPAQVRESFATPGDRAVLAAVLLYRASPRMPGWPPPAIACSTTSCWRSHSTWPRWCCWRPP